MSILYFCRNNVRGITINESMIKLFLIKIRSSETTEIVVIYSNGLVEFFVNRWLSVQTTEVIIFFINTYC